MRPWGLIIHQEIAHHKNGLIVLFSLDTVLSIDSYVSCGISFVPKVLFANSGELMSRRPPWESDHLTACGWPIKRGGHCNFPVNEYFTVFPDLLFNIDCVFYFLFSGCCYLTMHVVDFFYCTPPVLPGKSVPMCSYNFPVHLMSQYLCTCCIDTPVMNMSSELDIYCHTVPPCDPLRLQDERPRSRTGAPHSQGCWGRKVSFGWRTTWNFRQIQDW